LSTEPGPLPASTGPAPQDAVIVGEILKAHGLRGEVVAVSFSENPARFARGSHLLVGSDPQSALDMVVGISRPQALGRILLGLQGVFDRTQAEALRGARLFAAAQDLPELPQDSYWERDLVGLAVVDRSGHPLGCICGVLSRLEQDLWEVATPAGGVVLVPAAREIVVSVDLAQHRVVLNPTPGLFGDQ
jgi:16S rRNA processing protein RimM